MVKRYDESKRLREDRMEHLYEGKTVFAAVNAHILGRVEVIRLLREEIIALDELAGHLRDIKRKRGIDPARQNVLKSARKYMTQTEQTAITSALKHWGYSRMPTQAEVAGLVDGSLTETEFLAARKTKKPPTKKPREGQNKIAARIERQKRKLDKAMARLASNGLIAAETET